MGDDFLGIFKTRAIVLKAQDYKESDKLVWLYSEKLGKISGIARGAKKNRSKFLSSTLPFCYGEYIVYKGRTMYNISEAQIIDSFQEVLGDLDTLTYASYLCELIDICMGEEESNRDIFREVISAFYLMKNKAVDLETLARTFELRILKATGYGINFDRCCICKKKINTSNYISVQYSGGVCNECGKINGIPISFASYNALKYINKISIEKIVRVILPDKVKNEIYKVLAHLISQNYLRKPKSLETLNLLKRSE